MHHQCLLDSIGGPLTMSLSFLALDRADRGAVDAVVGSDLPMASVISDDGANLFRCELCVTAMVGNQGAADVGKALALLDVADHGAGHAIVCGNLPVAPGIGADRPRIRGSQFVPSVASFVGGLFLACRPAAVLGRVAAFVVDSLKGKVWRWTQSHIGQEVGEHVPTRANGDAASSVVLVALCGWVVAALKHALPRPVFCGLGCQHTGTVGEAQGVHNLGL